MDTSDSPRPFRTVAWLARLWETTLAELDLTLPQYRTLAFLSEGEWAASRLADRMSVSRPSVTGLVDGLVARGYVERRHSETDRRRVLHMITEAGRAVLAAADERLDAELESLAAELSPGDRGALHTGLVAVGEVLRERHGPVPTAGASR